MDLSPRAMKMLIGFEGKHKKMADGRYKAYRCPAGVWTIYAGLTKGVKEGMICSEADGEKLLRKELNTYEDAVERLVKVDLNQNQFDALTLLVYNIGAGAFQKSTLLRLLNQGKYVAAAAQFERWNKGGGRVLTGLVKRRKAEAALFMEPMADEIEIPGTDDEPMMPQAVEPAKVPLTAGATTSPTIWSSLVALVSTGAGAVWQTAGTVATETTAEVGTAKQSLSGFDALWSHFGVSMGTVLAVVTLGALAVVLVRHVQRYAEGRA
jgi:lysozyme